MKNISYFLMCLASFAIQDAFSQSKETGKQPSSETSPFNSGTFAGLSLRNVGPAVTSGRILDIAVNPKKHSEYYLATAGGGVWKTVNSGVTFYPIFDKEASFSIGCISLDPSNPNIVWVGKQ